MTRVVCVEARKILVKSSAFMAPVKDRLRALLVRIRPFLGGRDWIYLLALLVPLIVYDLVLKGIRIHSEEEHAGLARVFELIRSDLLFNLGYALLWIGLFALVRRGLIRWLAVVLFHASAVLVVAITTCAHFYFEETGSTLDLNVIIYSLTTLGEIGDVIDSVASPAVWALAVAVLLRGAGSLVGDLAGLPVEEMAEPSRAHESVHARISTGRSRGVSRGCRARFLLGAGRGGRREHILLEGRGHQRHHVAGRVREAQRSRRGCQRVPEGATRGHVAQTDRADREAQRRSDPPRVRPVPVRNALQRGTADNALSERAGQGEPRGRAGLHGRP